MGLPKMFQHRHTYEGFGSEGAAITHGRGATDVGVRFVREDHFTTSAGEELVYRRYEAPDVSAARRFLEEHLVSERLHFLVVETPDGEYVRDVQGIYEEAANTL